MAPALWWVGPLLGLHFIRLLEFYLECLHCQSFKWIVDSTCLITIIYCVSCHTIHIVEVCALFELFELSLSFALSFALFEFAGCSAVAAPGIALGRAGSDELPLAYQLSHQQMTCTFCYEPSFHLPFRVPTLTVSKWSSKDAWNCCQTFGVAGEWMRRTVLAWDGEGTCRFWPCTLVYIFLYWLFIAVPASALCRALLVFCWFC